MMGVGKSTVGRALAARLGLAFRDSDAEVARRTGRSVPELIEADGLAAFRVAEAAAVADLAAGPPAVVALGGGAVLDPASRAALAAGGTTVWLRARLDTLLRRVGDGHGRPLLVGDPEGALRALLEERTPVYQSVADVTVDVDDLRVADAVDRVAEAVG